MRKPNALTIFSMIALILSTVATVYLLVIYPSLGEEPPSPTEATGESPTLEPTAEVVEADTPTPIPLPPMARIAFASNREGNDQIFTMNPDGSDVQRLTEPDIVNVQPVWSPDGTRIAFYSNRNSQKKVNWREIYTMNDDGSDVVQVTDNDLDELEFHWSPDSSIIAYTADNPNNVREIHVIHLDSGEEEIIGEVMNSRFAWSPDSSTIAGIIHQPNGQGGADPLITLFPIEYRDNSYFPLEGIYPSDVKWSPDGTKLAVTVESIDRHLYIVDRSGATPPQEISTDYGLGLSWSPDGAKLAYFASDGGPLYLWVHDLNTNMRKALYEIDPLAFYLVAAWSPDSRLIAFESINETKHAVIKISTADPFSEPVVWDAANDSSSNNYMPSWQPIGAVPPIAASDCNTNGGCDPGETCQSCASDCPCEEATATSTALPTLTATPASGLPDLVVDAFGGDMVPAPRCLPLNPDEAVTSRPYSICVLNQGIGPAGSFDISVDDNLLLPVDGLGAGEEYCIASGDGGQYFGWPGVVRVDPDDRVAESDETNNYDGFIAATPPPFCTATP